MRDQQHDEERHQQPEKAPDNQHQELSHHGETPRRIQNRSSSRETALGEESSQVSNSPYQFRAETLALFAPSMSTPPNRRNDVDQKAEWRARCTEASEIIHSTSLEMKQLRDCTSKPTPAPQVTQQQRETSFHVSLDSTARRHQSGYTQAMCSQQQRQLHMHRGGRQLPESQGENKVSYEGSAANAVPNPAAPDNIICPPSCSVVAPVPFLRRQLDEQLADERSSAGQQIQGSLSTTSDTGQGYPCISCGHVAELLATQNRPQDTSEHPAQVPAQSESRRSPTKSCRGRKRRDCCDIIELGTQAEPLEPLNPHDCSKHAAADSLDGVLASFGDTSEPRHANHILEYAPLLMAKVLQLLPAASAAAFGSTCKAARRVLLSYCCILSLSARNVSSILSLPEAAMKRLLPLLSGLRSLEVELTSAVYPPLILGNATVAITTAATGGESPRPLEVGDERDRQERNSLGEQTNNPRLPGIERRQQQTQQGSMNSTRQHPSVHPEGERGDALLTQPERSSGDACVSHLSWVYGRHHQRVLDLLRLQSTACGELTGVSAETKGVSSATHSAFCPWTTYTAANASPLFSSLRHLKSVTAKLKLSSTGAPGEHHAATELLLLLQQLLHMNAYSLASIKISVDLSASSPAWRHIPPLLLPPSLPVLKSLHIDFPFQVPSTLSISLGFSSLSIHSAHRLMLMKTDTVWREPRTPGVAPYPCCPRTGQAGSGSAENFAMTNSCFTDMPITGNVRVCEIDDPGFETLKAQMGEAAPAASAEPVEGVQATASARTTEVNAAAGSMVVALLLLSESCMASVHPDGGLCFIRRKGAGPSPFSGQAIAFLRRGASLLTELSSASRSPFVYRMPPSELHDTHEEPRSENSLAQLSLIATGHQQQQEQRHELQPPRRYTSSLRGSQAPRRVRPSSNVGTQQQQDDRATQEVLVRALQHILGVGAESLQLLDIDGEVRHFSVLYEQLNFKCLRRLSLGWTITPELQQLLYLFSRRKLRSLQKLNFNGPAQIHPEAYIHIHHASSASDNSRSRMSAEPYAAPLDEATLRRSAGLNNYGLGQIHLQLYALLNCGACSVSQIDYARQQLLQQQLIMISNNKNIKGILSQISSQQDPLCLDELDISRSAKHESNAKPREFSEETQQQLQGQPTGGPATPGVPTQANRAAFQELRMQHVNHCNSVSTLEFSDAPMPTEDVGSIGMENMRGSSCRHRAQQAGSWLWRAIPSSLRGLAGSRGNSTVVCNLSAQSDLQGSEKARNESHIETQCLMSLPETVPSASFLKNPSSEALKQELLPKLAMQKQRDRPSPRRRRPSLSGESQCDHPDSASPLMEAHTGRPRPKRRRLVETALEAAKGSGKARLENLRRHVAALAREHLPLLGDLISPYLDAQTPTAGGQNLGAASTESLPTVAAKMRSDRKHAQLQVLKGISSFLLDAAGESLGRMLVGADSTTCTSSHGTSLALGLHPSHPSCLSFPSPCIDPSQGLILTEAPAKAALRSQQPLQRELDHHHEEDDAFSLLRLLQHPSPSRSSWSHGVFFKYAFVDLDFECLATFRICLCHHPLFIFYKEHEKGLHVLHVDGVFNAATESTQEKRELWRERLSYTYVGDPAVPFEHQQQRQQHQQESRRHHTSVNVMQSLEAFGRDLPSSSDALRRAGNGSSSRRAHAQAGPTIGSRNDGSILLLPLGSTTARNFPLLPSPHSPKEGEIRLCSARARLTHTPKALPRAEEEITAALLPHVGPQMTGYDLFCLEMWSVPSLCRDQVSPPTLSQHVRALRRLWVDTLTQQQRDIYNNIITPKYIARRLKAPDLTFEALPPWWQQQCHQPSRRRSRGADKLCPSVERGPPDTPPTSL
ncbi:hypothetical protein cyc_06133 [Cyclospora cayetanensis]|uniref:Uncharacterized protein n=1 Tax=Cyclospora cayetanensis TaxID=88456 RepID=A0A1D3D077_9EIME|nr:hypothetical protein cyc_06133 [Cyclospora cayetanensis]